MSFEPTQRSEWSEEENLLAVFFASRKVTHAIISSLLQQRGFFRGRVAVTQRLKKIRKECPSLMMSGQWNRAAVDAWISQNSDRDTVSKLSELYEME